jgi:hypothetical protein
VRLEFDKEIEEIYSEFDESLIRNGPNEEMEEPAFLIAVTKNLNIMMTDIGNAFLDAKS